MTISIVTGANRGIGLELARQLCARGESVVAVCRTSSPGLSALGVRVEAGIDLTTPGFEAELAARFATDAIGLLIHNAGVLIADSLAEARRDDVLRQFELNALAPLLATRALLPRLSAGSKIALVTSRMGSIADNDSGGYYGYRMSKAALNAAGMSLARDLAPREIAVVTLHPGFVRTEMTGGQGLIDAADSARGLLARIDALTLATTGRFLHQNGDPLPW
jgi:NAD(P)-dependent dehydrogenase (short-subunit alcohol dehydrogenase family)